MKRLYHFKCQSGSTIERYTNDTQSLTCNCGKEATKAITAARYFQNTTGKSPSRH